MSDLPTEQLSSLLETFSKGFEIDGKLVKPTLKQLAFVRAYIINNGNATDASRESGYKGNDKTLQSIGTENLSKPVIKKILEEHQKLLTKSFVWTADDKRKLLREITNRCMTVTPARDRQGEELGEFEFDPGNAIRAIAEDNKMVGDLAVIKTDNIQRVSHEEWLSHLK